MASERKALVSREFLMRVLTGIQNLHVNWNRDILTFTAFLDTTEELGEHVMREFLKLPHALRQVAFENAKAAQS